MGLDIHWYITPKCNLDCSYCFQPNDISSATVNDLKRLAKLLVTNKVDKVILGGGEPLLAKGLEQVLNIFKENEVYVSLHTNALLLDEENIEELSYLVDDIAIPLDSFNRDHQKRLRGEKFLPVFDFIDEITDVILENQIRLGYHTVFTLVNEHDIPQIYNFISKKDFDYWRIYELNLSQAIEKWTGSEFADEKIKELISLSGIKRGTPDSLYSKFLRKKAQMAEHEDKRIQFISELFYKSIHVFLDNSGDIGMYDWFSKGRRTKMGNIFEENLEDIEMKIKLARRKEWGAFNPGNSIFAEFESSKGVSFFVTRGTPLEYADKRAAALDNFIEIARQKKPELIEILISAGGSYEKIAEQILNLAEPDVRKEFAKIHFQEKTDEKDFFKKFSYSLLGCIRELNLKEEGKEVFYNAMAEFEYIAAKEIADFFLLGKEFADIAITAFVESKFEELSEGKETFPLSFLYGYLALGPGLDNPVGQKIGKLYHKELIKRGDKEKADFIAYELKKPIKGLYCDQFEH